MNSLPTVVMNKLSIGGLDACWEWCGACVKGYGKVTIKKKHYRVHRLVYEHLRGPIADGLTIDHLCRNRACANPRHMEPVTNRENVLRGDTIPARHALVTHCPRGHEYTEENTYRHEGKRYCRECKRIRDRRRSLCNREEA